MRTAFITHPDCLLHEMGMDHPESPERLRAIDDRLIEGRLMEVLRHYDAPAATREQLCRIHTPDYVAEIFAQAPHQGYTVLDPDTAMNPHTLSAALHAAGAGVLAVDLVMAGEVDDAFCSVRPPGHHAEPGHAMGFCLFNNIAVAAAHASEQHGLERVAIVDFDVHHGNGTEAAFHGDERFLFCSSFRHPFYPHTEMDPNATNIVYSPLRAGAGSVEFREAVMEGWLPRLESFAPQMIFISAGFDAHRDDDMGGLRLVEADYAWVTREVRKVAERHAGGRVVSMLEGGYDLKSLGLSVAAHIRALMGI